MRCLTLAQQLTSEGFEVCFISRQLPGNINNEIDAAGFTLHRLREVNDAELLVTDNEYSRWLGVSWEEDAGETREIVTNMGREIHWLVVDHYALDKRWEDVLKEHVDSIMVIDDLANRPHSCDLLLDQNLHANPDSRYEQFLPQTAVLLSGPKFSLLRSEFRNVRKQVRKHDGPVKNLLVFFGGADPGNETTKALKAIQSLQNRSLSVDVVIGKANPHVEEIRSLCSRMSHTTIYHNNANMAELMVRADISLGAGGTTTWERCCLGLPTLIIAVAENQVAISTEVEKRGMAMYLGTSADVTSDDMAKAISKLCDNPEKLNAMSKAAMTAVDGNGTHRVVGEMLRLQKAGASV